LGFTILAHTPYGVPIAIKLLTVINAVTIVNTFHFIKINIKMQFTG